MAKWTFVRAIIRDIQRRENLDAYVAILLGVVLAVLGLGGAVRLEFLAAGILATLTATLWTVVSGRHQLRDLSESIERNNRRAGLLRFADFPNAEMRPHLRAAREISLTGLTLYRFVALFGGDLEYAAQRGARVRIIVVDANSEALTMATFRSPDQTSAAVERERLHATVAFLAGVRMRVPRADIELRALPYLAPYALMIVTPDDPHISAYYHARLLPFRSSTLRAPTIVPETDAQEWIEFIDAEFTRLWDASTPMALA